MIPSSARTSRMLIATALAVIAVTTLAACDSDRGGRDDGDSDELPAQQTTQVAPAAAPAATTTNGAQATAAAPRASASDSVSIRKRP